MRKIVLFSLLFIPLLSIGAKKDSSNAAEARQLFEKVYKMVFASDGCSLNYAVNIVGLYKTNGHIIYKGKKKYFEDEKMYSWTDGTNAWRVLKKEKLVKVYRADDERQDKYMAKFKFDINNFTYIYKEKGDTYEITAKVKNSSMMGVKHVTAVVNKKTLYPQSLKVKVAFFSTTVKITNFKTGNISDNTFVFPKSRFAGYKLEDHRKD